MANKNIVLKIEYTKLVIEEIVALISLGNVFSNEYFIELEIIGYIVIKNIIA